MVLQDIVGYRYRDKGGDSCWFVTSEFSFYGIDFGAIYEQCAFGIGYTDVAI